LRNWSNDTGKALGFGVAIILRDQEQCNMVSRDI
jgi:hypothetical protein